ncbi:MAG TPA: hypothetical protein VKR06_06280 [Ktedonosporobacter sp.]|nr:hypothetical protein [Ktedonosporobacter sp.]
MTTRTVDYQQVTNTKDEYFDLVSTLYHKLKAAKTYASYAQDAKACGDQELAQFFQQCQQSDLNRVDEAKRLLATRAPQHSKDQKSSR